MMNPIVAGTAGFSFGQVCRAMYRARGAASVDQARDLIKAWQRQGYVPRCKTGTGRPGSYPLTTVWKICLIGALQQIGVSPLRAIILLDTQCPAPLERGDFILSETGPVWLGINLTAISDAIEAEGPS